MSALPERATFEAPDDASSPALSVQMKKLEDAISLAGDGAFGEAIEALGEIEQNDPCSSVFGVMTGFLSSLRENVGEREWALGELQMAQIELEDKNELLEHEIAERKRTERELQAAMTEIRLVLDNVEQGLLTIDRDGVMSADASLCLERWFGRPRDGMTLAEYLRPIAPDTAAWFELAWEQVVSDILPKEVALGELPSSMRSGGRSYHIAYSEIRDDERGRVLVVISDVTLAERRAQLEMEQRETLNIFQRLMADRAGFIEFFEEASRLVDSITSDGAADRAELARELHTLKGNAMLFGIETIARQCHELEDRSSHSHEPSVDALNRQLRERWEALRGDLQSLLGDQMRHPLEIDEGQLAEVLEDLLSGRSRADIARKIASWRLEPTRVRLERFAEQARSLARRWDKRDLEVEIDDGTLRTCPETWAPFWAAFIHVIRNAVSHGVEQREHRVRAGKPPGGRITLRTAVVDGDFVVEASDDGSGIDWDAVIERARAVGVPCESERERVDALFAEGVSSADGVNLVSGRGVGLSAVWETCRSLGGHVEVESARGEGTMFRFRFSSDRMAPQSERADPT